MIINISCGNEQSSSTVIKLSNNNVEMLREGPIKSNQIKEILGSNYEYK
jgi:tRNA A37 threonylcarbamoyladenosine synthetase subunit TsaC/SUA5/YrdC